MIQYLKYKIKQIPIHYKEWNASRRGSASYWTEHIVPNEGINNSEDSLKHFHWRNAQYPGYIELMPVKGQDDKVVLDYGCGPGNDLLGFSVFSKPKHLFGVDVSKTALEESASRLALHNSKSDLIHREENKNLIPIDNESVDYIHTSGVLHHCKDLDKVLSELYRILKPGGEMRVMVYNYDSLWVHLFTAYFIQIERGFYQDMDLYEAFKRTTDGPYCPIAKCYKPKDFVSLLGKSGFDAKFLGAAISLNEMKMLPKRFTAIQTRTLANEHRDFLSQLTFNEKGIPLIKGEVAGIDACYKLTKNRKEN